MRREDREITNFDQILEIIDLCKICRLGLVDDGLAYIVPLNFGYQVEAGRLRLCFHSATAGRKLALMRAMPQVSFEIDCGHALRPAPEACRYGFSYQSVMGLGRLHFLDEPAETAAALSALSAIMRHQTGEEFRFGLEALQGVLVYTLQVDEISAKRSRA